MRTVNQCYGVSSGNNDSSEQENEEPRVKQPTPMKQDVGMLKTPVKQVYRTRVPLDNRMNQSRTVVKRRLQYSPNGRERTPMKVGDTRNRMEAGFKTAEKTNVHVGQRSPGAKVRRRRGDRASPGRNSKKDLGSPSYSRTKTDTVTAKKKVLTTDRIASRMKTKKLEEEFEFPSENGNNDSCLLDDT